MSSDFFDSERGGDPALFQNLIWYFGHPSIWFAVFLWICVLVAILKVGKKLSKARKWVWLAMFNAIVGAALIYYAWLLNTAHQFYVEGRGAELENLNRAKLVFLIMSMSSLVWIIVDWIKGKMSK